MSVSWSILPTFFAFVFADTNFNCSVKEGLSKALAGVKAAAVGDNLEGSDELLVVYDGSGDASLKGSW